MKKIWGVFWTIMALSGAYAIWTSWRMPSESKNAFLFGMSKSKLTLCAGMAIICLICVIGAILSFLGRDNIFSSGKAAGITSFFLIFALVLAWIFLTPPVGKTSLERSLFERLVPFGCWAAFFSALALILLIIQKSSQLWKYQISSVPAIVWGCIVFICMAAAIYYALLSGTGLEAISGTFYRQGVSLLEGHLIVPLLFLYPIVPLAAIIGTKISGNKKQTILMVILPAIIWAASVCLWQTTVFEGRSYFAPALRAPNYNFYPASDAENYDLLAQSILIGNGFRNGLTVVRPLYAAFLSLLHFIFGNDYMKLTNGQILLLALIPVTVFLIGKRMGHTAGGLLAAVWVIWREIYTIRITPLVQVSNSRLLMSDLPTMFLTVLVILCFVKWWNLAKEETYALLCGGMIGTSMLLRTQCFVLIPLMWLIFFCSRKKPSKKWLSVLFSIIGFALVFAPWTVWGKIHPNTAANADVSEGQYLVSLYQTAVGESDNSSGLLQLIMNHPGKTIHAVGAHFLNNEISSLLVLPVRLLKISDTEELFYDESLFWYRENAGETIKNNQVLMVVYLLIITFGIISAVRKNGFCGMIPFMVHIVYNLGNAFALTSGFRFILPVDWIIYFYFAFGCAALMDLLNRICLFNLSDQVGAADTAKRNTTETENQSPSAKATESTAKSKTGQKWSFTFAVLMLAIIGAILPLCEIIIPLRFTPKTSAEIEAEWKSLPEKSSLDLSNYRDGEIVFLEGRAFYPRFYKANEGDSGGSSSAKRGLDYDRLVWMFHDKNVHVLSCRLTDEQTQKITTAKMPDPLDVIVIGIPREDYIEVLEMRRLDME